MARTAGRWMRINAKIIKRHGGYIQCYFGNPIRGFCKRLAKPRQWWYEKCRTQDADDRRFYCTRHGRELFGEPEAVFTRRGVINGKL